MARLGSYCFGAILFAAFATPGFASCSQSLISELISGTDTVFGGPSGFTAAGQITLASNCVPFSINALELPLNGTAPQPNDPFGILQHNPANWITITQPPTIGSDSRYPGLCTKVAAGSNCYIYTISVAEDHASGETVELLGVLYNRVAALFFTWGDAGQPLPDYGEGAGVAQHGVSFSITSAMDNATPRSRFVALTGTANPGDTVTLLIDGASGYTTSADSSGYWEQVVLTGLGSHTIQARDGSVTSI